MCSSNEHLLLYYHVRSRRRKKMTCLETQYFNLNRILLLAIGVWPYKQSNFTRFQFIFLFIILTTSLIFQCSPFISHKCTLDFVIKVLSSASFFALFVIKYIMFYVNIKAVKDLLEQLQYIYNELKDKNEFAIIFAYGCSAKRCTAVLTICGICSLCALIVFELWSEIFHVILPMNISRSHGLPFIMEYFVDQEIYFYWILLHINVSFCVGITAMVGIGTTLIAYFQHICGMFRISSYRIKRAMQINTLKNYKLKNEVLILEGLISAVDIHRQSIKLSKLLVFKIEKMLFSLILVGVISLSLNLFRIFQIISYGDDIKEILLPFIFVTICILYMFVANYIAQDLTDHNNDLFAIVYDVQWYEVSLHIQKLILFLLQQGTKKFAVSIGGLFVGSLECFATLVKTSVSYFTVIYSTQ
ncbi:odorant receptor 9a-like [Polyergus mexicanus]|uniref:odorant receptor 9a-like n=1 Tax=Polyergus mexicanus TaxID=615972 RepID=UPI0038B64623